MFCKNVSARFVLWLMTFLNYTIQYLLISNLNIAVTAMVDRPRNNGTGTLVPQEICNCTKPPSQDKFHWDESQEASILGAVYWLMWAAHLVGGTISHVYGSKLVIGYSILFSSGLSFVIPISAIIHYKLLMVVRIIQGFIVGLSFPSIMAVVQYWIPEHDRGKFVTVFLGINVGAACANLIGGLVIRIINWEAYFYVTGLIGVVWCFFWKYLIFDKPSQHPRMTNEELSYLNSMISTTVSKNLKRSHKPIPWWKILTSVPVISTSLVQFGTLWALTTLIIYAPTYIKLFYNLDIFTIGLVTGIPYLLRAPASIAWAAITDKFIENDFMSTTNVRKLSTFISNVIPGAAFGVLVMYSDNLWVVVTCMGCAIVISGAAISGSVCGLLDISPTFGGVLQGLAGSLGICSGFLIPLLVGYLTLNNNTMRQWNIFFSISGSISALSGLLYLIVWDSEVTEWDGSREDEVPKKPLKTAKSNSINPQTEVQPCDP